MSCTGRFAKILLCVVLLSMAVSAGAAQRRRHGGWPAAVRGGGVVFIGGYFYDPFYGPYPWWPPAAYPFPYYPLFNNRAEVRVLVTPEEAAVYVDGFYAGVVDDFNGLFQRLPLPPGGHDIVVYYDGYRTVHHRVYLQPDGARWSSSDGERFVVHLAAGPHRVEVVKPGYDRFSTEVQVREGGRLPLNVTLTEESRDVPLFWR